MDCPLCAHPLDRVRYEGFPVRQCKSCKGYLLEGNREKHIKRTQVNTREELGQELQAETKQDTLSPIACPRCPNTMKKETLPGLALHIDRCDSCKLVWFDGGELAAMQWQYESSTASKDRAEFKQRISEMSDERQQAFEENVSKLKENNNDLISIVATGFLKSFFFNHRR